MTKYIFSQFILNWYHKNGRKDLPWQKNKTLYTVWISEIMLQQTTVKSVIPYFKKFILNFPNIKSLNDSTLDDVLHLWSGLGYYNRAKNIYKSAQIIKKDFQGIFPDQFLKIIKLPGIGKTTAGAILSLSLNFFYPILDGNVKRILMRYYGISAFLKDKKTEKKLWKIIESITPIYNTGKFNQGMMDIGSSICTPVKPKCKICPLNKECIAKIEEKWEQYPLKNIKKIYPKKTSWFIIIKHNNYFWLIKNTEENIWKNLFCFPKFNSKKIALKWLENKKININSHEKMTSFVHKFSHFSLHIHLILIKISCISNFLQKKNSSIWYNLKNPQHIGLPQPVQKILKNFKKDVF
ncbi:A/G-specific adenine glycosylase [Buchnera aphidicola str. Ak (Acyrthosiphon kondoi)]|uniref:Adenine DNA glycosylase n=1 Tax=Buchnera aphidicola str. Ak (Acyrthosiphon kondoi) TaxID=1005090 RepID=G2LM37_9GAMM|nr:A/G-specific adenine glycosylase [Buchnera aphidicola]AEO08884.1 A/G-specific adenine glycosylase [Buchnera aphidicola str. Ak (Acyrthosiphon kondoi)]